jgi:hypothetical protein
MRSDPASAALLHAQVRDCAIQKALHNPNDMTADDAWQIGEGLAAAFAADKTSTVNIGRHFSAFEIGNGRKTHKNNGQGEMVVELVDDIWARAVVR